MNKEIGTEEFLSVMEAAAELGTTHLRILMLIKDGVLKGIMEGNDWFVTRDSIDCFSKHGGDVRAHMTCRASCGGNCGNHG